MNLLAHPVTRTLLALAALISMIVCVTGPDMINTAITIPLVSVSIWSMIGPRYEHAV